MKYIDLHTHTTASDGTLTPRELVARAADKGLAAVAITDHDTVEGAAHAAELEDEFGVEVVPGIEISAEYFGYGIHILGYFIDPASPSMARRGLWPAATPAPALRPAWCGRSWRRPASGCRGSEMS